MSEVVTLQFVVPTEHATEAQIRCGRVIAEIVGSANPEPPPTGAHGASGFQPHSSKSVQGVNVWNNDTWQPGDEHRAEWLVNSLPDHPRQVLELLYSHAGEWVSGDEIAAALGLEHGSKSVPPSFKSLANRCRRAGRCPMWNYDNSYGYRMPVEYAPIFKAALED